MIEERVEQGYSYAHKGKENDVWEKSSKKKQVDATNNNKEGELVSPKYSHGLPRKLMNSLRADEGDGDLNDEELLTKMKRKRSVKKEEVLGMNHSLDVLKARGK